MREIVFYRTSGGRVPASDFLSTLEARIAVAFQASRTTRRVPADVLKRLSGTSGLWEIRVRHRGHAFRFLCFFDGPALIVEHASTAGGDTNRRVAHARPPATKTERWVMIWTGWSRSSGTKPRS